MMMFAPLSDGARTEQSSDGRKVAFRPSKPNFGVMPIRTDNPVSCMLKCLGLPDVSQVGGQGAHHPITNPAEAPFRG